MAVTTKTIMTGGDYTSIGAWESAAPTLGTDIWKGVISDNREYAESVTLGAGGTASLTSYLWLTTDPANRHAGVAGTAHGRICNYATDAHCLIVDTDYTRIDWLDIEQNAAGGSSAEGIRLNSGVDQILISHCIIWTDNSRNDQDGIYTASPGGDIFIDNCFVYGWHRSAIHQQASQTIAFYVDHCGLMSDGNDGSSGSDQGGALRIAEDFGSEIHVYNTWGVNQDLGTSGNGRSFWDDLGTNVTWYGSNNANIGTVRILGTDNTTSWNDLTSGWAVTSKTTGSWLVVNNVTPGSENWLLLDDEAGNTPAGSGTDRQGSEPDPRQDFSIDITGSARPTTNVDIGPHQITAVSGGTSYDDLNLLVSVASTISEADALVMDEVASFTVTATVDSSEGLSATNNLEFTVQSTVDAADQMSMAEHVDVVVVSTVDGSEQLTMAEATDVTVVVTVDGSDAMGWYDHVEFVIGSTVTGDDSLTMVEAVEFAASAIVDNPLNTMSSVEAVEIAIFAFLNLPTEDYIPFGWEPTYTGPSVVRGVEHRVMESDSDADSHPERTINRPRIRRS